MKIEKINDRQIRCTLTKEDLASRQIRLSELAYGSEKARELFQDMMEMAAENCGFEADNVPLMIEAVPISQESILLIITKVEEPEELDARFSRFSPDTAPDSESQSPSSLMEHVAGADDIIDLLSRLSESRNASKASAQKTPETKDSPAKEQPAAKGDPNDPKLRSFTRMFLFETLDDVIRACAALPGGFEGSARLYKIPESGEYYLLLRKEESSAQQFNSFCNTLSEYGLSCKYTEGMDAYFSEHMECILSGRRVIEHLRALY